MDVVLSVSATGRTVFYVSVSGRPAFHRPIGRQEKIKTKNNKYQGAQGPSDPTRSVCRAGPCSPCTVCRSVRFHTDRFGIK